MEIDLYAGIPVSNLGTSLAWYERLFGVPPSFVASATEAVWDLADHRAVFLEESAEHAGHARHSIFVADLDALVGEVSDRGIDPILRESYGNGVRKAVYRDPDGNEVGFGDAPQG